jgi:hypothetical protein
MRRESVKMTLRIQGFALFLGLLSIALGCATARAQEIPARQQGASLQVFGLMSYVQPHFNTANNIGGSLGADLNFRPLDFLEPSLEIRGTFAPGSDVTENTYQFGPRVAVDFSRVKPYLYFLIGSGSITFHPPLPTPEGPYTHDGSVVYSGGAGVDYMLTPQLGIRADAMLQHWNLGDGPLSSANKPFYPHLYSFGVDYRFDFNRIHRRRR